MTTLFYINIDYAIANCYKFVFFAIVIILKF